MRSDSSQSWLATVVSRQLHIWPSIVTEHQGP
jgi:hypothetical protein